jgi:hypothetical protein
MSMGMGKMIVLLFSAAMLFNVCKYLSTIIFPIPIDIVAHFMGRRPGNPTQQLQAPAPTHQLSTTSTLRADDSVQIARWASQSP